MAYTELYMQTTGSNVNAGSTNTDAASVTATNGSWDITAETFIATAATPFSAVAVGEWASIYIDGATSAVYVAQVTALYLSGLGVVLSATAKYGTKPAASATARTCKIGGAWGSLAVVTSLFAAGNVPAATRVNIKAGTYANTTTSRSFTTGGLTTGPLWWRGYKTVIGDMDSVETVARVPGTDIPLFTWTSTFCTVSGAHQIVSNIAWSNDRAGAFLNITGDKIVVMRCQIENIQANASSYALHSSGTGATYIQCIFTANVAAIYCVNQVGSGFRYLGCMIVGGGDGALINGSITGIFAHCVFRASADDGLLLSTAAASHITISNCTFYAHGGDGINVVAIPASMFIHACLFVANTGYGINNSSGANTNLITRYANAFHGNTAGRENGFGDAPAFFEQIEPSSPIVDSTHLTLLTGALSKAAGLPGLFEQALYQSYLDIGAAQRAEAGASGAIGHANAGGGILS